MQRWSHSTRAGQATIPDSRRPDIRIGRDRCDSGVAGGPQSQHRLLLGFREGPTYLTILSRGLAVQMPREDCGSLQLQGNEFRQPSEPECR